MTEPHAPTERRENKRLCIPFPAPESEVDRQRRRTNQPMTTPAPNPPAAAPQGTADTQLPTQPMVQPTGTVNPSIGTASPWKDGKHTQCHHLAHRPKTS